MSTCIGLCQSGLVKSDRVERVEFHQVAEFHPLFFASLPPPPPDGDVIGELGRFDCLGPIGHFAAIIPQLVNIIHRQFD